MTLPKLFLPPAQAGYTVDPQADTLQASLGSGPSRFRRDMIGAVSRVSVQWRLGRTEHEYLEAFLRSEVPGSLPFLIDLILDGPDLAEYTARLMPGSKRLSSVQGLLRAVDAVLEVRPRPTDTELDLALVALFSLYGEDGDALLDLLAELVNVDMPMLA